MKKRFAMVILLALTVTSLTGCGSTASNVSENAENSTEVAVASAEATEQETEAHEHSYTETITKEATCTEDGEKTLTCECGDTKTEVIPATGHIFENYVSNNDATYTADGTETAKCNNCDETDTRTAEGSMLTYTYTDMDKTMYAQSTVNVRSLPDTTGEKLGGLSQNDEIKVTGQCNETSWYRFELNGQTAYVNDKYVGTDKVVVEQPKVEQTSDSSASTVTAQTDNGSSQNTSTECPYELYTVYDDGTTCYAYTPWGGEANMDADTYAKTSAATDEISRLGTEKYGIPYSPSPGTVRYSSMISWEYVGTYNGVDIVKRYYVPYVPQN